MGDQDVELKNEPGNVAFEGQATGNRGRRFIRELVRRIGRLFARLWNASRRAATTTAELERQLMRSLNPRRWPTAKQLRHGYRVLTTIERHILRTCLTIIVAASIWLGINQAINHIRVEPAPGGTYTDGTIGQAQFVTPLFATTSAVDADLTRLVFSGLFRYDAALKLEPDLADRFTRSDDGRTYTVILKDHLAWHDGEPLTADDVIFTFTSIVNPDVQSPLAASLRGVVVEKLDDLTVRFTLKDPYSGFPDALTIGLIPEHIWAEIPFGEWRNRDENLRPIGSGMWQFNSLSRDADGTIRTYVLNRAPQTHGPTPFLDQLIFKLFPDASTALTALQSKSVDGLAMLSRDDLRTLHSVKHINYYDLNLPAVTAVFFNLDQASPLQDVSIRRALRLGTNKRALVEKVLNRGATVAQGPLPLSATPPLNNVPTAGYNPDEANALLERAGWQKVGAIRQNKQGEILDVSLSVIDHEPDRSVAELIQEQWRSLGVETKIDLISPASPSHVAQTLLRPRAYQALLYTIAYGATLDLYPFWHSSQRFDPGLNFSLYRNRDADSAIEQLRRSSANETRTQALAAFSRQVFDDVPAIFLYSPTQFYAISNTVHGVTGGTIAVPADRFNAIVNWYVKVKRAWRW